MLTELDLLPVYDSAEFDLVNDLMVPLLSHSKSYIRGVGYFSSGWLKIAAQGMQQLVEHGGSARFVVSPILEKKDWEAMKLGIQAKSDSFLQSILEKNADEIAENLEQDTLNTLAWMIADDLLNFKFAISRGFHDGCDYHDKVGIFKDKPGNLVAIHGSFNDSIKGTLNGEAFSVFRSWENGHLPFVKKHEKRLTCLWENGNRQFNVFTIPEVIKKKLIKLRKSNLRPYKFRHHEENEFNTNAMPIQLYDFQKQAVQQWIDDGYSGIFEIATGTGKTYTALGAAFHCYQYFGKIFLVILVPFLHLLEQWEKNCTVFDFIPLLCSGEHKDWPIKLRSAIQDFKIDIITKMCVICTHKTASSERFLKIINSLSGDDVMLIGDEVHSLGATNLGKALSPVYKKRLGLSATPRRWFDDKGTEKLFNYFNGVSFYFGLDEAIQRDYLTHYDYYPELVQLTNDEMEQYEFITKKISRILSSSEDDSIMEDTELKKLLLKRSRLIAAADMKLQRLLELLSKKINKTKHSSELKHVLIYCAPGHHKDVLKSVSSLGLRCHEFVHTVSLAQRSVILKQFAAGDIQVIVAIKCLDEGVDVPATESAYFLASTTNPREFVQRRGRLLRKAPEKEKSLIYDFLVVPHPEDVPYKRDIDKGLLKREMPRFVEFSSNADNEFEARKVIWDLLDEYELLNLFDEKAWDIYKKLSKEKMDKVLFDMEE
ncbi:DEAD/DEAH box helicase family protein [candidate division CSSED10-310 bacterium]|uniref:DEAD/DEAH box helicase family protein n=1 Tax=candidate division CSSED10-310 bacterium TaxID=2855610 RepID=A0ABV6YSD9_UNCC1